VSLGLEVIGAVVAGVIAGNAVADVTEKWKQHYPRAKDVQAMEDNYGATGDSFFIWRGRNNNPKKGWCNTLGKFAACALGLLGIGELARQAYGCYADGSACANDEQPGQLVIQTSTPTMTATPTVTLTPNCSVPYQQCSVTVTPTFTVTNTGTPTATHTHTATPSPTNTTTPTPTNTSTPRPTPIHTLHVALPY